MRWPDRQADSREHARRKQSAAYLRLRVREDTTHQGRARREIALVVDEVDGPLVRKAILALKPHEDGHLGTVLAHLELSFA